jgi:hypothetical protein
MPKLAASIMVAAFAAAVVTVLSAPAAHVSAGPRPAAEATQMHACAERPWPYLRCVGTPFGNPKVRLVAIDRIAGR